MRRQDAPSNRREGMLPLESSPPPAAFKSGAGVQSTLHGVNRMHHSPERDQPEDASQRHVAPSGLEPAMHLTTALARLGGDSDPDKARSLLIDLAKMFLEDYPDLRAKLKSAIDDGRPRDAERFAHSIKGLSATFDGHPTHRAAYRIEKCSAAGDLSGAASALPDLECEVERLFRALRSLVE